MTKIAYEDKRLSGPTLEAVALANTILVEYARQGYDLTLRQLFYQHVARGLIANSQREYKRLGTVVSDGRMNGLIDWNHIVDRTRYVRATPHWDEPGDLIDATAGAFKVDLWDDQDTYVEVWIEKDALVGVIQRVCGELDVPYLSCRGYTSQSEMWGAGRRLGRRVQAGKRVVILHLGDHDPSGIDMTRDITDRLRLFVCSDYVRARAKDERPAEGAETQRFVTREWRDAATRLEVRRIALTMDQVEEYGPPPNPARVTDSRARGYIERYGHESWELDALEPAAMHDLIRGHVEDLIDTERWDAGLERELKAQSLLRQVASRWDEIVDLMGDES